MTAKELRAKFLEFFKSKGHALIPSSSLIPENDPTALFISAGMQPLVPYLLGQKHPEGKRLANVQKCLRTGDIDEVGDTTHHTFFEMLGNWSLGDYFKKEAIEMSFQFLTKELNIPLDNLAVSVFAGDADASRDEESADIWLKLGIAKERLAYLPKENNWWGPVGQSGPCGPDTEMFYWSDAKSSPPSAFDHTDKRWVEIWNDVFMQYYKTAEGKYEPLEQQNVDTGMGLERAAAVLNGLSDNYLTDLFLPIIRKIEEISGQNYTENSEITLAMRVMADHLRAAVFVLADPRGIVPGNLDQGYILRRLIRRALRFGRRLGIKDNFTAKIAEVAINNYADVYGELKQRSAHIYQELEQEENKFSKTLARGLSILEVMTRKIHRLEEILSQFSEGDIDDSDNRAFLASLLKEEWLANPDPLRQLLETRDQEEIKKLISEFRPGFKITGKFIFDLYTVHGFPPEMIEEIVKEIPRPKVDYTLLTLALNLDLPGFRKEFQKHQELSRVGAEQKFHGGLADHQYETIKLHTATHLLHATLRKVLGEHAEQRGSNITSERLRFDFAHPTKVAPEQIQKVEAMINEVIKKDLPMSYEIMTVDEARQAGAIGLFEGRYDAKVKVYTVG